MSKITSLVNEVRQELMLDKGKNIAKEAMRLLSKKNRDFVYKDYFDGGAIAFKESPKFPVIMLEEILDGKGLRREFRLIIQDSDNVSREYTQLIVNIEQVLPLAKEVAKISNKRAGYNLRF